MSTSRFRCAVIFILAVASSNAFAQSGVDSRVQRLEETVQALERRVASLEAQLRERGVPTRVAPGKEGWRKLQKGMTESEVEELLGSPSKVNVFSTFSVWRYGVGGRVQFDDDKRVDGWSEP